MKQKTKTTVWTVIIVLILVVLLLLWQWEALFSGDTDVSAPMSFINTVGNFVNFA